MRIRDRQLPTCNLSRERQENFRPRRASAPEREQRLVGTFEWEGLHCRPYGYARCERQEFGNVSPGDVRGRLDLLLHPEMVVVAEVREVIPVRVFLADWVDDKASAGTQVAER